MWTRIVAAVGAMWALAAFATFDTGLSRPAALPTRHFLESGFGRVLDGGAGLSGQDRWRPALTEAGFDIVEQGTQPATLYVLAQEAAR